MSLTIAAGEVYNADTRTHTSGIELGGTLNLSGEVFMTAAASESASGTGEGTGTATARAEHRTAAAGEGEGVGERALSIAAGDTLDIAAGTSEQGGPINVGGTLNLGGTLNVADTLTVWRAEWGAAAAGEGGGTGTAVWRAEHRTAAAGEGEGVGTADAITFLSMGLTDSAAIDETRRDEFDTQGRGESD